MQPANINETSHKFETEYAKGFPNTVNFLKHRGLRHEEAEEVAQAAWARGWERLHQLVDTNLIRPWVNSIAWRLVLSTRRRKPQTELPEVVVDEASLRQTVQVSIEVRQALELCSPQDRGLLEDRFLKGDSFEEIGERTGLTAVCIRVRIHRTRTMLQGVIGRSAMTPVYRRNDVRLQAVAA